MIQREQGGKVNTACAWRSREAGEDGTRACRQANLELHQELDSPGAIYGDSKSQRLYPGKWVLLCPTSPTVLNPGHLYPGPSHHLWPHGARLTASRSMLTGL